MLGYAGVPPPPVDARVSDDATASSPACEVVRSCVDSLGGVVTKQSIAFGRVLLLDIQSEFETQLEWKNSLVVLLLCFLETVRPWGCG